MAQELQKLAPNSLMSASMLLQMPPAIKKFVVLQVLCLLLGLLLLLAAFDMPQPDLSEDLRTKLQAAAENEARCAPDTPSLSSSIAVFVLGGILSDPVVTNM